MKSWYSLWLWAVRLLYKSTLWVRHVVYVGVWIINYLPYLIVLFWYCEGQAFSLHGHFRICLYMKLGLGVLDVVHDDVTFAWWCTCMDHTRGAWFYWNTCELWLYLRGTNSCIDEIHVAIYMGVILKICNLFWNSIIIVKLRNR